MRSHSGKEKKTGKVHSPILPHTNFSLRAGQINQLILLVDAQFLGMFPIHLCVSRYKKIVFVCAIVFFHFQVIFLKTKFCDVCLVLV